MNENEIMLALQERYKAPEYALLPQVRSATGAANARTADALAMGLWPSRGLELHGFEIKVDRGDWLRELKQPAKAEEIARFCDRWWIAAADAEIVKPGELPSTWGLLIPRGQKLIAKIEAPVLEAQPITKKFLAAILRKAAEVVIPKAQIKEAIERARKDGCERGKQDAEYRINRMTVRVEDLEKAIREFEESSGVKVGRWDAGKIGEAVSFVLQGGVGQAKKELMQMKTQLEKTLAAVNASLDASEGTGDREQGTGEESPGL